MDLKKSGEVSLSPATKQQPQGLIKTETKKTNTQAPKVKYENRFKKPKGKFLEETFPKSMRPTKRTEWLFEIILLFGIAISLINFPFGELMQGNFETAITIGYPFPLIEINFLESDGSIMNIGNFILDILIYLGLAYIIDIIITLIFEKIRPKKKKKIRKIQIT